MAEIFAVFRFPFIRLFRFLFSVIMRIVVNAVYTGDFRVLINGFLIYNVFID